MLLEASAHRPPSPRSPPWLGHSPVGKRAEEVEGVPDPWSLRHLLPVVGTDTEQSGPGPRLVCVSSFLQVRLERQTCPHSAHGDVSWLLLIDVQREGRAAWAASSVRDVQREGRPAWAVSEVESSWQRLGSEALRPSLMSKPSTLASPGGYCSSTLLNLLNVFQNIKGHL